MNKRTVFHILGTLLLVLAGVLVVPLVVSLLYRGEANGRGEWRAFLYAIGLTAAAGGVLHFGLRRHKADLGASEGFAIVTLGWTLFAAFGALPLYFVQIGLGYTDCFFETMSGLTTTGASIIAVSAALPEGIESLPKGIGFWRCMTQWLGGMGIVLLTVAILPVLGTGGYQLFRAEVPGPTKERLTPRIRQTAVTLWKVYALLTVAETLLLWLSEMPLYDALCHTFTTLSTGGFSTKNASIGFFSAPTQWIIMLFMFLAGINFVLHYRLAFERDLRAYFRSQEFRWYCALILIMAVLVFSAIHGRTFSTAGPQEEFMQEEKSIRTALFGALAIITTTGYANADFDAWPPLARLLLLLGMFLGGCAGSTAGGLKTVRVLVMLKYAWREIKQLFLPRAVLPIKFEGRSVSRNVLASIAGFFILWMLIVAVSSVALAWMLEDTGSTADSRLLTALSAAVSMIGNIGPGLADVGPYRNYAAVPVAGKWLLTSLMLLGRLEIYSVLILLLPHTWRK